MNTTAMDPRVFARAHHDGRAAEHRNCKRNCRLGVSIAAVCILLLSAPGHYAHAQVNGVGQRPYLGWSTFSEQTINNSFLTQANITAQSDAMQSSGLEAHGFRYINIDSGWMGSFDAYGRPIPNTSTFPDFKGLIAHIHANGQKAGIYWIPGIEHSAVVANYPILGTPYHLQDILKTPYTTGNAFGPYFYKIDYTKPGAQAYINSVVDLFASWGIDSIKLDGVTPGSYNDNLSIDNRADVAAWSKAIAQSGRPIWLTVSWALDQDYLSVWQQYANARRIEGDVECEGNCATITDWAMASWRFYDLVAWENASGVQNGWNDLDSLEVGNLSSVSGLDNLEQQSVLSLWALANAPLYLGGDLNALTDTGKQLLTNDDVIAVDQAGHPARQIIGGDRPVWVSDLGNGTYYVGLFNLNAFPSTVTLPWNLLTAGTATQIYDLWNHTHLATSGAIFSRVIPGHGAMLLKVTARGNVSTPDNSQSYEAESATLNGSATVASCPACSGGLNVGYLGLGAGNNVTFNNVNVSRTGVYWMQVDSMTIGPRSLLYRVNGGPFNTINVGGGSFLLPSSTTVAVPLKAGVNTIQFGNPTSYPPDLDRIVISGDGSAPPPDSTTYEAENATLTGTASPSYCAYCSGASEAGNIGGGPGNNVTFTNVVVPRAGTYQLEIDYLTSGSRSYTITVNDGPGTQLNLNGSSFSLPTSTVIPVQLHAGSNTIQPSNATGYAPALDRIAINAY
jgi:alpha-galactosidase